MCRLDACDEPFEVPIALWQLIYVPVGSILDLLLVLSLQSCNSGDCLASERIDRDKRVRRLGFRNYRPGVRLRLGVLDLAVTCNYMYVLGASVLRRMLSFRHFGKLS